MSASAMRCALLFVMSGVFTSVAVAGDPPMISTRGSLNYEVTENDFAPDFYRVKKAPGSHPTSILPELVPENAEDCPEVLVLYVHGYEVTADDAVSSTAELATAIGGNQPGGPTVAGFSWDSDPPGDPDSNSMNNAFGASVKAAKLNAGRLAAAIKEIKEKCPGIKIHIVSHSLGAEVVIGALKLGGCSCSVSFIAAATPYDALDRLAKKVPGGATGSGAPKYNAKGAEVFKVWTNSKDYALDSYGIGTKDALGEVGPKGNYELCNVSSCCARKKKKGFYKAHSATNYFKAAKFIMCLKKKAGF